jgi:hypothetical protein
MITGAILSGSQAHSHQKGSVMQTAHWPLSNRLEMNWIIYWFLYRITPQEQAAIHTDCKSADMQDNARSGQYLVTLLDESSQEYAQIVYPGIFDDIAFDHQETRARECWQYFSEHLSLDLPWAPKGKEYEIPFGAHGRRHRRRNDSHGTTLHKRNRGKLRTYQKNNPRLGVGGFVFSRNLIREGWRLRLR